MREQIRGPGRQGNTGETADKEQRKRKGTRQKKDRDRREGRKERETLAFDGKMLIWKRSRKEEKVGRKKKQSRD